MPKGNNFSEINPAETVTLTFDFGPMLTAGVTISSPQAGCSVISGTDPSPSSRLDGAPAGNDDAGHGALPDDYAGEHVRQPNA
jgi:hypothetical protein